MAFIARRMAVAIAFLELTAEAQHAQSTLISLTHPLHFLLTRGHWWGAADSAPESAAPISAHSCSVTSYLICADVRTFR